jgi:hypothetical protein
MTFSFSFIANGLHAHSTSPGYWDDGMRGMRDMQNKTDA